MLRHRRVRAFPPLRGARARNAPFFFLPALRSLSRRRTSASRDILALRSSQWDARRGRQGLYKAARSIAAAALRWLWWWLRVFGRLVPAAASPLPGGPGPRIPGRDQVCGGAEGKRGSSGVAAGRRGAGGAAMSRPRGASGGSGLRRGDAQRWRGGAGRERRLAPAGRRAGGPAGGVRAPCVRSPAAYVRVSSPRPSTAPELSVRPSSLTNSLPCFSLPSPGLLLCGCWRLLVVTGECVCAPGQGASVRISQRGSRGAEGPGGAEGRAPARGRAQRSWPVFLLPCVAGVVRCPKATGVVAQLRRVLEEPFGGIKCP